jgi:hypothetical protein
MRNNTFKVGDRVRVLVTSKESGDTLPHDGIVKAVKGVSLLVQFDHSEQSYFINYRVCIRLIKPKPRYIHVEKCLIDYMYKVRARGKELRIWEGKTEDNSFYNLKLPRGKRNEKI